LEQLRLFTKVSVGGGIAMKKLFPGYYPFTDEQFSAIWNDCFFVLDTNEGALGTLFSFAVYSLCGLWY